MFNLWRLLPVISALYYGVECNLKKMGGSLVTIENHPYVVSVQEKGSHKCNGVILTDKFVLTSGHCLDRHIKSYTVLAAADDLSATFVAQRFPVADFKGHTEVEYDLGLIQLQRPLNFSEEMQPIGLPKNLAPVPDWGYLVGFGSYRMAKFRDRLRAMKASREEKSEKCDHDNDLEFCVGAFTGSETPNIPNGGAEIIIDSEGTDPAWVSKDKEDPWEWSGSKKTGMNRRTVNNISTMKDIAKLEDSGSGVMNEFAIGSPFVRDGILYGFISRKDGETAIMTSVPQFIKFLKSSVFELKK